MRLQKQLSRKVGEKQYPKWVITIPPNQIKLLNWNEGEFLKSEIVNQGLVIEREDLSEIEKRSEAARKAWIKRKQTEE